MAKIVTIEQMRSLEAAADAHGVPYGHMMEMAGEAVFATIEAQVDTLSGLRVVVLSGPGNNGGDGLVMARHLAGYGAKVTVILLGDIDGIKTDESNWNWSILEKMSSVKLTNGDSINFDFNPDIIVDAILGTGISGIIREPYASAINYINECDCFKIAVDVPSGLDPQTGETANIYTKCDMTVTFHKMKQGIPKRKDLTGELFVEKIGIPPEAEDDIL